MPTVRGGVASRASTEGEGAKPVLPRSKRLSYLVQYLILIVAAEAVLVLASLANDATLATAGLFLDLALVVVLPIQGALLVPRDGPLASFLSALALVPLVRVVSLTMPFTPFSTIEWLAIVSVPLLLAALAVMQAQGLRPADVYLAFGNRRYAILNVTLVGVGFFLGIVEYWILSPEPWILSTSMDRLVPAVAVVFVATGLAEELIFRGVVLRAGLQFLGRSGAVVVTSFVFAVFHIGFLSILDVLFVFGMGLLFGFVVLATRALWGAVGAHTMANVMLYLILPFGL